MARADGTEHLAKIPLFSGLNRKELQQLARRLKELPYAAGATIVREGDTGVGLYVIGSGSATVLKQGRAVAHLRPGDFFGEVAVLDEGPRTATVVADTDTVCLGLPEWEVRALLRGNAEMTYKVLREVVRRLRQSPGGLPD